MHAACDVPAECYFEQIGITVHRLYLSPYETTPTYRNVHNKFSVSYLLNLVLVDEEDRRYFKQQEIVLYRLADSAQVRPRRAFRQAVLV